MKNIRVIIFVQLLCIICGACEFFGIERSTPALQHGLHFINTSNEVVCILPCIISPGEDYGSYIFYNQLPDMHQINSNDTLNLEKFISNNNLKSGDNLQILVFKQSTLDKYSEEEIIRDNIYDARYVLTEDDLVDNTFTIVYTGD